VRAGRAEECFASGGGGGVSGGACRSLHFSVANWCPL
jgi:hypothetical protein